MGGKATAKMGLLKVYVHSTHAEQADVRYHSRKYKIPEVRRNPENRYIKHTLARYHLRMIQRRSVASNRRLRFAPCEMRFKGVSEEPIGIKGGELGLTRDWGGLTKRCNSR